MTAPRESCTILIVLFASSLLAQKNESTTRIFMDNAHFKQINKDWSTVAEFSSGIGETVKFYPIEVINLKTKDRITALQLDMDVKKPKLETSVWVGLDEVAEFIKFIEDNVIPNIETRLKDKSSEYIFKAKEMTMSYLIDEKKKRLSISLNDYGDYLDNSLGNQIEDLEKKRRKRYYFWTETQIDEIPKLLEVLKKLK